MYFWPHLKIEIFQTRKQKMSKVVPEKVSFASIFSLSTLQLSPMFSLVLYRNNLYQIHATFTMEDVNKQKTVLNKNKFYFKYILRAHFAVNVQVKFVPHSYKFIIKRSCKFDQDE